VKQSPLEEETKEPTPSPKPPPTARITRASRRLASARQQRLSNNGSSVDASVKDLPKSPPASRKDREGTPADSSQPADKTSSSRLSKTSDDEKNMSKDDKDNEEAADSDIYKSPRGARSPVDSPSPPSAPPPAPLDEDNYTICHGTPLNQVQKRSSDMSSPKSWQNAQHGQQQLQHQLQQQQQQQASPYQQPKARETAFGSPGSEQMISPEPAMPNSGGSAQAFGSAMAASHLPDEGGRRLVSSTAGNAMSDSHMPLPPQYAQAAAAESFYKKEGGMRSPAASAYPAGGMPGAYQPGNYPYPMPYPWRASSTAIHHQHLQQAGGVVPQGQPRPGEVMLPGGASRPILGGGGGGGAGGVADAPSYSAHGAPLQSMHATATQGGAASSPLYGGKDKRKSYSDSPSTSPGPIPATLSSRGPPGSSERGGSSAAAITGGNPMRVGGSTRRDLVSHQLPHGFPPGMAGHHSQLPYEHLPPHSFPYSFEPAAHPSALHMWQQTQGHHQIPGMHPPHLPPSSGPPGLWYPGPGGPLHPHLMQGQGQDLHAAAANSGAKKGAGSKGKRDGGGDKMPSNRNNSNNINMPPDSPLQFWSSEINFTRSNSQHAKEPQPALNPSSFALQVPDRHILASNHPSNNTIYSSNSNW